MKTIKVDDLKLLGEFVPHRAESAFEFLVDKYIDLVFSAAPCHTRQRQLAEDVTQAVFIILSRKAGQLTRSRGLNECSTKSGVAVALRAQARRLTRSFVSRKRPQPDLRSCAVGINGLISNTLQTAPAWSSEGSYSDPRLCAALQIPRADETKLVSFAVALTKPRQHPMVPRTKAASDGMHAWATVMVAGDTAPEPLIA